MAEWFFRTKSKGEVERDPGWDEYFTSNRYEERNCLKRGDGSGPGSPRRFIVSVDQFARTRDFFELSDADEFLKIQPREFNRFHPLKI